MNKSELKILLHQSPYWLLLLFTKGELTQEEINHLWFPRTNHTKNLAAKQRKCPRSLKQVVKEDPRNLLLSMVRVEQWHKKGQNNPRGPYWKRKSVKPDQVVEDPYKFSASSDLMEEIAVYAEEYHRAKIDGLSKGQVRGKK